MNSKIRLSQLVPGKELVRDYMAVVAVLLVVGSIGSVFFSTAISSLVPVDAKYDLMFGAIVFAVAIIICVVVASVLYVLWHKGFIFTRH